MFRIFPLSFWFLECNHMAAKQGVGKILGASVKKPSGGSCKQFCVSQKGAETYTWFVPWAKDRANRQKCFCRAGPAKFMKTKKKGNHSGLVHCRE